ncbi:hypothetical protein GF359_10195 [candidate division WOR-3 bacterium]|uniref:Periplasmic heavy metal sensor n=1 Tax=candidate division WOR-3 bacterium TaxID=2052148 RepID=A0A9D5KBA5_UNCW3|nr:hypothetical protein [candidate division WOR-3 bacterium]MBD3365570.1 hypothetical protein [candidate division WOR-3 bacterium]
MKRCLVLLFLAASTLLAQPSGIDAGGGRVLEMISAYRITRMTQELGLADTQIAAILPRLRERDSIEIVYRKEQAADYSRLETEVSRRSPNDRKIAEIMERMQERERVYTEEIERIRSEILQALSVEQQAGFIVFEVKFEKEIKDLIERVRGGYGNEERENNQPRRNR